MIGGHAALAFALVASVAARSGDRRRALRLGAVAGAFAVVPDVDMAFAVVSLLESGATGVWSATTAFWAGSDAVHRAVTHSLVLAVPGAAAFALVAAGRRLPAAIVLAGLVAAGLGTGGPIAAGLLALYATAGVGVGAAASRLGLGSRDVALAAMVGLLSHPFGDVFTGEPPHFLFPAAGRLLTERIALSGDPTVNLLSVFGLELLTLWLAVAVAFRLLGRSIRRDLDPRAIAGAGYGGLAVVIPAPTLDVSYHFVFSVLAVGTVGAPLSARPTRRQAARAAVTGLAAVTLAVLVYGIVYSTL